MKLAQYQLLAQIGAGRDGVSYRACGAGEETLFEIRVLSAAQKDQPRWERLQKRLRLAAIVDHPSGLRLCELNLNDDPPYAVSEWVERRRLIDALAGQVPLPVADGIELACQLAGVLASAHRLGLAHGRISPAHAHITKCNVVKLDFTGIATNDVFETVAAGDFGIAYVSPEVRKGAVADLRSDVYSFGVLLSWMFFGVASNNPFEKRKGFCSQEAQALEFLQELIGQMTVDEAAERLSMQEVMNRLNSELERFYAQTVEAPPAADADSSRERQGRLALAQQFGAGKALGEDHSCNDRLGRFRLLEKLGQGGMGTVYRAEDSADGAIVAIKILRPELAENPQSLRRFRKEACLLAEVNNPFVANLIEINEDQGVHFLVMEFVAGKNIRQMLEEKTRLEERTALILTADVCRALIEAHKRGVVHRDVKPDNIVVQLAVPGPWSVGESKQETVDNQQSFS